VENLNKRPVKLFTLLNDAIYYLNGKDVKFIHTFSPTDYGER